MNVSLHKPLTAAKLLLICTACVLPIVFSQSSREGVAAGVSMCLNVLVPSLFPMMALTNLFVKSGLCQKLGKPLNRATRAVFGVSGSLAPVLVMGLLGGYPVGAGGIASLRKQNLISEQEARQAALFTVCAGPGFVINFVGTAVYQSKEIGLILFAAQVLSVILTGILARLFFKKKSDNNSNTEISTIKIPLDEALVESVYAAARGMVSICAFVLLFSALTGILAQTIANQTVLNIAYTVLEVCTAVTKLSGDCPITWVAFAVGFGGLCVHFQIFAALGKISVNKGLFFFFRIIQGFITAGLTELGLKCLPQETAVFSTAKSNSAAFFGGSVLSGAVVVGVMICFLVSVKQQLKLIKE